MVAPLNSSMLIVALPDIRQDFGVSHNQVAWLISAYLIAMAVAQPLGGRLGDQIGRARVFRIGMISFLAFSMAAMVSPNFTSLIVFRTGQALVSSAIMPNAMAMLRSAVPLRRLGEATGSASSAIALSAAVGPLVGAVAIELGSWRLLYLVNLPLFIVGFAAFTALKYRDTIERHAVTLDWGGAFSLTALLVGVSFLLGSSSEYGTLAVVVASAVVVGALGVFVQQQRRSDAPIGEWGLFRNRSFAAANAYVLLGNLSQYAVVVTIPFFVEELQGKSASTTAPLLAGMPILMAMLAPIAGRLADAQGRRLPAFLGACMTTASITLVLLGISADVPFAYLAVCMAMFGFGIGLGTGPATTAAIESAPRERTGAAAGTLSMMRYVGGIIGAGVLGGILTRGDTLTIDTVRLIFGFVLLATLLAVFSATLIHRFAGETQRARDLALSAELTATGGQ